MASQWQSDYYFVGAHIGFGYSSEDSITVLYESPVKPDIALAFTFFYGTTVQQQITTSSDPAKEIKTTDSVLDSPEILAIALSQKDSMKFSRDHFWNICGYLNLDKRNNFPGHPPIWRVEIQDCRDPINSIDIYLDPKTGERLIE